MLFRIYMQTSCKVIVSSNYSIIIDPLYYFDIY
jgi:hypothetical protein